MSKLIENLLIDKFKDRDFFDRQELLDFYKTYEPDLKEGTFAWRIYDLKNRNIIKTLKRGKYAISYKPKYKADISEDLLKLIKQIPIRFKDAKYCVWESSWLIDISQHQSSSRILFIEIDKELVESFFYQMKDSTNYELYFEPKSKEIEFYISESKLPVVIKRLITRAPITRRIQDEATFYVPQLEKILVDVFADDEIFYQYRGYELVHIYENAIKKFTVNFTKLFSYAQRRNREVELNNFLNEHLPHLVSDIFDD